MNVLVSDTSVLIDLERGGLLEVAFRLPCEFVVPDLLYKRELASYNGPRLVELGLRIEALDEHGLRQAIAYRASAPALSLADCFALALAKIHDWTLLAGDSALRALALAEQVEHHGVLWIFDRLLEHQCAPQVLYQALTTIAHHPRCRLPPRDIKERLDLYHRLNESE